MHLAPAWLDERKASILAGAEFNGLWRVNRKGQFNVPMGRYKNPRLYKEENVIAVQRALQQTQILHCDFTAVLDHARQGDLVYFDPPYVPISATSNFTTYAKAPFGLREQQLLRDTFVELTERGVFVMLSNSMSPIVQDLYEGFNLEVVYAPRAINSKSSARGHVPELVVTNYPPPLACRATLPTTRLVEATL